MIVDSARAGVGNYLDVVTSSFIRTAEQEPPPPDLDRLRDADIPTVSDETFAQSLAAMAERRRKLHGLVEADARDWPAAEED